MKDLKATGLKVENGKLFILDQRLLPHQEVWLNCQSPAEMCEIIYQLQVRGAPLIGVAAAVSLAIFAEGGAGQSDIRHAAEKLNASRPTAVNLMAAMDRMVFKAERQNGDLTVDLTVAVLVKTAEEIFDEDVLLCEGMAKHGTQLIEDGDGILTHCNTGGLATVGIGTALGVIIRAHQLGKNIHVYVDETRPLLQGGRLTTWELEKAGVPYTLLCDNMAATLMRDGKIQKIFVGSDRVAANGDFANKIGTYTVAVNAKHHGVAFYPVAPYTTVDLNCPSGKEIPIEERVEDEVRGVAGHFNADFQKVVWSPKKCRVYNPAFDVTPVELISGLVLDSGVFTREQLQSGALKKRSN